MRRPCNLYFLFPLLIETTETSGEIRGVTVRWIKAFVSGHCIEQMLMYEVAEAEEVLGAAFDDELDRIVQMGMFAIDRIATDGTMWQVATAASYVVDGKCIRTAKIRHCDEIRPISALAVIIRDGKRIPQEPWSCVEGSKPICHDSLLVDEDGEPK